MALICPKHYPCFKLVTLRLWPHIVNFTLRYNQDIFLRSSTMYKCKKYQNLALTGLQIKKIYLSKNLPVNVTGQEETFLNYTSAPLLASLIVLHSSKPNFKFSDTRLPRTMASPTSLSTWPSRARPKGHKPTLNWRSKI